jgi:hypothetical protein
MLSQSEFMRCFFEKIPVEHQTEDNQWVTVAIRQLTPVFSKDGWALQAQLVPINGDAWADTYTTLVPFPDGSYGMLRPVTDTST